MALKVNEVVIQAKLESDTFKANESDAKSSDVPASVRKEIIDECLEKLKEYIDLQIRDARR